jgi:hypothetical protein
MYDSRFLNKLKQNYNTRHKEALAMVFALQKLYIICWAISLFFYVYHMALVYLVNKPQVSRKITRWLLLILEYDFIVVYKPNKFM